MIPPPPSSTPLSRSDAPSPRQGPRRLRDRRRPADRRDRPHLRVRLRARLRHSRQGQGADAAVGVLVRADGRSRAAPPDLDGRRRVPGGGAPRTPTCCAAGRCWCAGPSRSRSNASRAATCRARAGRNTSRPAASAASRCRPGLRESDRLPEPIFTPATKAETGHDVNISEEEAGAHRRRRPGRAAEGADARDLPRAASRTPSRRASSSPTPSSSSAGSRVARRRATDEIVLIDEVLTPDSSRFWPQDQYEPGHGQPSFDKQFVRDYLEEIKWNKQPPVPSLPDDVVQRTREKYVEPSACCPAASCSSRRARSAREPGPADARQGRALRRRAARVREGVHHPRAAALEGQRRRRRRAARPPPQHRGPQDDANTGSRVADAGELPTPKLPSSDEPSRIELPGELRALAVCESQR